MTKPKTRTRKTIKVMKVYCACPQCEAVDSVSVVEYRVEVADTPLVLVFDPADKQQTLVPVFDRNSGETAHVECICMMCKSEVSLSEVLKYNERKRNEG